MIVDIGHVAIQTPDVDAAVEFATGILGMHETERIDGTAYLTMASPYPTLGSASDHHALEVIRGPEPALDHIGLLATRGGGAMQARDRATAAGATVVEDAADEPWLANAVRIAAPSGHVFEIYEGMEQIDCPYTVSGIIPHRVAHANVIVRDVEGWMRFMVDGLGFRVSDWIYIEGQPIVGFARCHFEHHTIACAAGENDGFSHYAFEFANWIEIGQLGDCLVRHGRKFMWGPVREVAGDNIAAYFVGPGDVAIEAYTDMQKIRDDAWEPRQFGADDVSMWSPDRGIQPLIERFTPLAGAAGQPATPL